MPSVQGGAAYPVALYDSQGNPLITSGGGLPTTITGPLGAQAASGSLSVVPATGGTPTDRSGTITAGGTAQQLAASNSSRRYLLIQNQSTGNLYIRFTGTAAADQTSLRIAAGDYWESPPHYCPTSAVSIIGATAGQAFHSVEA